MISKSFNLYINGKLTTRGFQRDQNYQISPCTLEVIAPATQCPNSNKNELWLVKRHIEGSNEDETLRFYIYEMLMK